MENQIYLQTKEFNDLSVDNGQTGKSILFAQWLCEHLPNNLTADYFDEDWGCTICFNADYDKKLNISCAHVEGNEYSIVIGTRRSLIDKILKKDKYINEAKYIESIFNKVIACENFSKIEWLKNS